MRQGNGLENPFPDVVQKVTTDYDVFTVREATSPHSVDDRWPTVSILLTVPDHLH